MDVQADLSLCWLHRSYCRFCCVLAHMVVINVCLASNFIKIKHLPQTHSLLLPGTLVSRVAPESWEAWVLVSSLTGWYRSSGLNPAWATCRATTSVIQPTMQKQTVMKYLFITVPGKYFFFQLKSTDIFSYFSTKHILCTTQERHFFQSKSIDFFLFLHKNVCCDTPLKHLTEALLMSTHNICFCGEIRKILTWYPLIFRPMLNNCGYSLEHLIDTLLMSAHNVRLCGKIRKIYCGYPH